MATTTQRIVTLNGTAPAKMLKEELVKLVEDGAEPDRSLQARFALLMTLALGAGIPLLSLALSKLGGSLLMAHHYALGAFAFALMASVLAVSLPHLASSIGSLTGSEPRPAWCLALALDLSLVLTELVGVYASSLGLGWVCGLVMVCVALASMCLNIHAFLVHQK